MEQVILTVNEDRIQKGVQYAHSVCNNANRLIDKFASVGIPVKTFDDYNKYRVLPSEAKKLYLQYVDKQMKAIPNVLQDTARYEAQIAWDVISESIEDAPMFVNDFGNVKLPTGVVFADGRFSVDEQPIRKENTRSLEDKASIAVYNELQSICARLNSIAGQTDACFDGIRVNAPVMMKTGEKGQAIYTVNKYIDFKAVK